MATVLPDRLVSEKLAATDEEFGQDEKGIDEQGPLPLGKPIAEKKFWFQRMTKDYDPYAIATLVRNILYQVVDRIRLLTFLPSRACTISPKLRSNTSPVMIGELPPTATFSTSDLTLHATGRTSTDLTPLHAGHGRTSSKWSARWTGAS